MSVSTRPGEAQNASAGTEFSTPSFAEEEQEMARRRAARDQSKLFQNNLLIYGDNLRVLRNADLFRDESVDLVYLDPPFKPNEKYNVLHQTLGGTPSAAQVRAFEDSWEWGDAAKAAYHDTMEHCPQPVRRTVDALRTLLGETDTMFAYVCMMAPRLFELRKVLRPTGSIYLHCDSAANHYLRVLMDSVFGAENFRNEIHWYYYNKMHDSRKKLWPNAADTLLFYVKDAKSDFTFHQLKEKREKPVKQLKRKKVGGKMVNVKDKHGHVIYTLKTDRTVDNVWRIPMMQPASGEWLGYPTQKPKPLLERIIEASTNEGDIVLDPFCGCGTTVDAAQELGRKWIGIDVAYDAVRIIRNRLTKAGLEPKKDYEVWGDPESVEDAIMLAEENKDQFEWWAVRRLGGRERFQRGADAGVDGVLVLRAERLDDRFPEALIQVKGGRRPTRSQVATLRGDMEKEKAEIGVLVTRTTATKPMRDEASKAGEYTDGRKWYPRIQLLTAADIIAGKGVEYPPSIPEPKPARQAAARRGAGGRKRTQRRLKS